MANAYGERYWLLDTAGTIMSNPVRVESMLWRPSAAAQTLTVKDTAADVILDETSLAAAPAGEKAFYFGERGLQMNGFVLTTLTAGGYLHVYLA